MELKEFSKKESMMEELLVESLGLVVETDPGCGHRYNYGKCPCIEEKQCKVNRTEVYKEKVKKVLE